jgi:hypothetical protein
MGHTIPHCMTYMTTRSNTGFACLVRENIRSRHKPLTGNLWRSDRMSGVLVAWRDYRYRGTRGGQRGYPRWSYSLPLPPLFLICVDPIFHMSSNLGRDSDATHPPPAVELVTAGHPTVSCMMFLVAASHVLVYCERLLLLITANP